MAEGISPTVSLQALGPAPIIAGAPTKLSILSTYERWAGASRGRVKPLGSLLTDLGWITAEQLEHALQLQEVVGGRLGTNLLELEAISEERLQTALSHQLGVPVARARDLRRIPPEVHQLLAARLAGRWQAVPFRMLGRDLHVALLAADDLETLHGLAFATGKDIRPFVANEARLLCSLHDHFQLEAPTRIRELIARLDLDEIEPSDRQADALWTPRRAVETATRDRRAPEGARPADRAPVAAADRGAPASPLAEWLARLDRLDDRDRIARALLDVLMPHFRRIVLLKLTRGFARGWLGTGPGVDTSALRRLRIDLTEPSVLLNLVRGAPHHVGTLPPMPAHEELASAWGGGLPGDCLVLAVRVGGRLACAVFCEPGLGAIDANDRSIGVGDLSRITDAAGRAFERCVLRHRELFDNERGVRGPDAVRAPAPAGVPPAGVRGSRPQHR